MATGITQRIAQVSQGAFAVGPGSLFPGVSPAGRPAAGDRRATENNRRAKYGYYRITEAGRRRLKVETEDWRKQTVAIARLLAGSFAAAEARCHRSAACSVA